MRRFGQAAGPLVVTAVAGVPTRYIHDPNKSHLLPGGVTFETPTPATHIWGAGLATERQDLGGLQAANVHALRGKLSHERVQTMLTLRDAPLGDPAYLAAGALGVSRRSSPHWKVGLVSRPADRNRPEFERLLAEEGVLDIDARQAPESALVSIADCEVVLSTCLDGLILAESLGIANLWIDLLEDSEVNHFEFEDWFSLAKQAQAKPCRLDNSSMEQWRMRAELHDMQISADELASALTAGPQLQACSSDAPSNLIPVQACRRRPLPIFVISFNRAKMMKRAIASYRRLGQAVDIIVHDNGSTDIETLSYLTELVDEGVRVVRRPKIKTAQDLNDVDATVAAFFDDWAEPSRFVVTDCDVDMSSADPQALDVYGELLDLRADARCAGPMLRIDDIPGSYPLYNRVMNRHIEQFWHRQPDWMRLSSGRVAYIDAVIDTTFGLHRAGEPFVRQKLGIRVYEPFEALHLDWYHFSLDDVYHRTSSEHISHWNNAAEQVRHADAVLEWDQYIIVRRSPTGELCAIQRTPFGVSPALGGGRGDHRAENDADPGLGRLADAPGARSPGSLLALQVRRFCRRLTGLLHELRR